MWSVIISHLCKWYGMGFGRRDWSKPIYRSASDAEQSAFHAKMVPIFAEFEHVRQQTLAEVEQRARLWVPIGLGAGLAVCAALSRADAGLQALPFGIAMGIAGGMYMASNDPGRRYRETFKKNVIPHLLARFGSLQCAPSGLDVRPLTMARVMPEGSTIAIEDDITGTYRGRAVTMAELNITRPNKDKEIVSVFSGMALEFELPREVGGRTIIYPKRWNADNGAGGLSELWRSTPDDLQDVELESPEFAERYQVRSNDQVGARVLLSPAFMEKLCKLEVEDAERQVPSMANAIVQHILFSNPSLRSASSLLAYHPGLKTFLGQLQYQVNPSFGTSQPGIMAVAHNGKLLIAVPKAESIDYFEPPPYTEPLAAEAILMHLSVDIQTMLDLADAVFDLDYRTRVSDRGEALVAKDASQN